MILSPRLHSKNGIEEDVDISEASTDRTERAKNGIKAGIDGVHITCATLLERYVGVLLGRSFTPRGILNVVGLRVQSPVLAAG